MDDRLRVELEVERQDDLCINRVGVPRDADEHPVVRVGDARRDPKVVEGDFGKADLARLDRPEARDGHRAVELDDVFARLQADLARCEPELLDILARKAGAHVVRQYVLSKARSVRQHERLLVERRERTHAGQMIRHLDLEHAAVAVVGRGPRRRLALQLDGEGRVPVRCDLWRRAGRVNLRVSDRHRLQK